MNLVFEDEVGNLIGDGVGILVGFLSVGDDNDDRVEDGVNSSIEDEVGTLVEDELGTLVDDEVVISIGNTIGNSFVVEVEMKCLL